MGREELGGRGDVLGLDLLLAADDLVLFSRDVELVEPADDLHVLAGLFGQRVPHALQDAVGGEEVVGHEELGVVVDLLEHEGHDLMVIVARGH